MMDQQDKKPTDPTPKAPGDPTSKKPDDQNQKPPTLEEEIRSFEKRAEAFLNNRGAQELVVESKELVSRTFTALQEKTQELEKEKEDHARNVRVLNEQIAIVHKEARESAEKEGIAQKEVEALKKEIRELREKTVTDLEKQLAERKVKTEDLEKQLAEARAKTSKEPRQDSPGTGKMVGMMAIVLLVLFASFWVGKNFRSGTMIAENKETRASVVASPPITNMTAMQKYREHTGSLSPVDVVHVLSAGNLQVVTICDNFLLREIVFEGDRIIAMSDSIDPFLGDGRQQNGFVSCKNRMA